MTHDRLFTPDVRFDALWRDDAPAPVLPDAPVAPRVDVAIVGSGYTGLNAALVTARGGRSTLVFDAEEAGYGCSARNGGQISTSIKPSYAALAKRHGDERAFAIVKEGQSSLAWMKAFVRAEALDCALGGRELAGVIGEGHQRAVGGILRLVGIIFRHQRVARDDLRLGARSAQRLGDEAALHVGARQVENAHTRRVEAGRQR